MNFYLLSSTRWWKIMRITFSQLLIALILSGVSFAKSLAAQDVLKRTVSITVANSTLENTLKKLEKDASVKFVYSKNIVRTEQKISFASTDLDLKDVLDKLLTPNGILYRVISDRIVLNANPEYLEAKKAEAERIAMAEAAMNVFAVKGKVTDETGPLPGVNIRLKGAQATGTTTDANGNYSLSIPDGTGVLEFSFVGYATQEVAVGGRSVINVSLQPNSKSLNEVVVIGYGTQKASNVTGAVATLKNENLDERPITRVDQALVGQLAGVTVKETSGLPGKAFSIQVRGSGSISAGNEPLYVIDGFPLTNNSTNTANGSYTGGNPLDNINPDDIESIQVLKDAAAAAIYGSRASNGVVLITTKHGKAGKTKITFNNSVGYNQASKQLQMLDGDQWIARATEMINAAYVLAYGSKGATAADNNATRATIVGIAPGTINTAYQLDPRWAIPGHPGLAYQNWQNDIEHKGVMQTDAISASGGNENVTYFISGNYTNQNSFIMNVGFKEYSARANVDIQANKNFKIGINVAPTYSITEDPGVEGKDNIFHQALSMSPIQEDSVGQLANIGKNTQYIWSNTTNSPVGKLMYNVGETKRFRTLSSIYGEYQIIKGLTLKSSLNLDATTSNSNNYTPYITTGSVLTRTFNPQTNPNVTSATSGSYSNYRRLTFVNENTLTYNTVIHNDHSLNILVGQSYNIDRLDQASLSSSGGYTSATIQTLSAAAATTGSTSATQSVLESYFSRVQYGYKDKYLLSASLRSDGSSRFGDNTKFGVFPSASLGWRIIQENFMKKYPAVSDLKLRVSYGVNGTNNLLNDYAPISQLGAAGYVLGSTPAAAIGQAPSNVANPNLQWETSHTWDGGIDMGFLNNRITASFDYYNKLNTNLLLNLPTLETTGFQSAIQNVGSVRNIGEELEVTTRNLVGKFEWSTSINVSHNTNKIVSLGGQDHIVIPNAFDVSDAILKVGQPLYAIYTLKYDGFLTAADIANKVALYGPEQPGDPKFEDINHDGVISEADKQIVGHPNPDYTWGITNSFRFKGFDLSVLIQGQNGGSIYSELGRALSRAGQGFTDNEPETFVNRWYSETNTGAGRFGKAYSTYNAPITASSDWLYSSNYFRVRDITLGYNLKNIVKTSIISAARIYITAENFFGHDVYTGGLNPEAANTSISTNSAFPEAGDYGGLPLAKSLIFGLNFTF
jgi:TonB-linked SusC/RagA family outer membrane protein